MNFTSRSGRGLLSWFRSLAAYRLGSWTPSRCTYSVQSTVQNMQQTVGIGNWCSIAWVSGRIAATGYLQKYILGTGTGTGTDTDIGTVNPVFILLSMSTAAYYTAEYSVLHTYMPQLLHTTLVVNLLMHTSLCRLYDSYNNPNRRLSMPAVVCFRPPIEVSMHIYK